MKTRILRPDEWGKVPLDGDMPSLLPFVAPQNIAIIVVEDDAGEIVGMLSALRVTHLEGLWVKPEYRGRMVAWDLYRQAMALAGVRDESWVVGGAADGDDTMDGLIRRCGGNPLPLRFYSMPVGGH
jgi:ribosomal protein S18 acetylase RimI-like enzyme